MEVGAGAFRLKNGALIYVRWQTSVLSKVFPPFQYEKQEPPQNKKFHPIEMSTINYYKGSLPK